MNTSLIRRLIAFSLCMFFAADTLAGGSGLNVVVVANQNSTNSLQLANYYCEKRGVPPQNVLRINWTGGKVTWARADFENILRIPLNALLTSRGLSNQIEYVVLSMDIPYRVGDGGGVSTLGTNSTTSALFYGFKPDGCVVGCPAGYSSCTLPNPSTSAFAGSEGMYRQSPPISATSNSWLTIMLTSSNLAQAKAVVDRGVAGDFQQPTQTSWLVKTSDAFRNVRYITFDDAMFDAQVHGRASVKRIVQNSIVSQGYQLGVQFALYAFYSLPSTPTLFAPGGLADSLTSFGGNIFDPVGHTHALEYLNAGATASYGTLVEPCAYLQKFPSPRNYFYQARGYTAAESYYMSLTNPYQGILVGEPLSSPYARPCVVNWVGLPDGSVLAGTTNLSITAASADATLPVRQVDLFLDGKLQNTITNLNPSQNNIIHLNVRGQSTSYNVLNNATLKSIATGIASTLNQPSFSNLTAVSASARGDRVELRCHDISVRGETVPFSVSNHVGTASALTTIATAARTNFLSTPAYGLRNFAVTNLPTVGSHLQLNVTKTNGALVSISVTNPPGNADTSIVVSNLVNAVNATPALQMPDGALAEDFFSYDFWYGLKQGEFNLRARSPGWAESQIQAELTCSPNFTVTPAGVQLLDEFPDDLPHRNHIYIAAGTTNLPLTFAFNTVTNADGWHELTAVVYEGTHVRTQTRASRWVKIQNTPLSATFTTLFGGSNTALSATLQFRVEANTNNASISRIELFSTGGQWGGVSNLATANFSLAATNLQPGLHSFCALVTRNDGKQYRTETKWIRIVESESPFNLTVVSPVPTLAWPAIAGRRYEIQSTTNVASSFTLRDAVVPTNSSGLWSETNSTSPYRFYRALSVP